MSQRTKNVLYVLAVVFLTFLALVLDQIYEQHHPHQVKEPQPPPPPAKEPGWFDLGNPASPLFPRD